MAMDIDHTLTDIVSSSPPADIPAVLDRMRAIETLLPDSDGLKWFDLLYRMVTEAILTELESGSWEDHAFITELDVVFANLYFDAVRRWLTAPTTAPRAWTPLLEARRRTGIAEVQFALAGMNAHINRDLPVAVVKACRDRGLRPTKGSPQHRDYQRVDDVLRRIEPPAIELIARGSLSLITRGLGTLDDVIAMWSVRQARAAAWTNAEVLWALQHTPELADQFLLTLDRSAGLAGRGLLVRTR